MFSLRFAGLRFCAGALAGDPPSANTGLRVGSSVAACRRAGAAVCADAFAALAMLLAGTTGVADVWPAVTSASTFAAAA